MKSKTKTNCPPRQPRPEPPTVEECSELFTGAMGPTGPQGPAGDPGPAISTPYDPNQSCSYVKGQVIFYMGGLWIVNENCPEGAPGSGTGYTLLDQFVKKGMTGPTGMKGGLGTNTPLPFDPEQASAYKAGQSIYYNGKFYQVLVDSPTGVPGSSPDYEEIPGSILVGPTGPMGPVGAADSEMFDPTQSQYYVKGQLIYYDGNLYVVNTNDPSGTPGASFDYSLVTTTITKGVTGPTGPTGTSSPTPFDPNNSSQYMPGQIIYYEGNLYQVLVADPQGVPGQSPDYQLITTNQLQGPMGPAGNATAQLYTPDGIYKQGDLVYYNGNLYGVNRDNPVGPPDQSADFSLINSLYSVTGPQGAMGPQGAQGVCSCSAQIGKNLVSLAIITAGLSTIQNQLDEEQQELDNINSILDGLEQQIQDNTDLIDNLTGGGDSAALQALVNSVSYCACSTTAGGCMPIMVNANTNLTRVEQMGTPCTIGTFFGCTVYRQCYYGLATSSGTSGNITIDLPVNLNSSGPPTMIVDVGGNAMDVSAGTTVEGTAWAVAAADPIVCGPAGQTGSWSGGVNFTNNTTAVGLTGLSNGNKTSSSVSITQGTPNTMALTLNGSALTTHTWEFWMYVDYIDCTLSAVIPPATGPTG